MNTELAWAAGFFDGEGSTYLNRRKMKRYGRSSGPAHHTVTSPSCSIAQADNRPLHRFVAAVGAGKVRGPYKNKGLGYYKVEYRGRNLSALLLNKLWPYLSTPKQEQALAVWSKANSLATTKSPPLPALGAL